MKIGYLIHLATTRTELSDASLGLAAGVFKWATVPLAGYAQIIDQNSLGAVSNENSAIYGGTFSTHNEVTLTVCNPSLVAFVNAHALKFVGCKASARLFREDVPHNLFSDMVISDYAPTDELTITLTLKDSVGLDGISTLTTAITSALIPSVDAAKLEDSLSTTIGNPAWVKLIPCTTSQPVVSAINTKGERLDLESDSAYTRQGDGTPHFPGCFFAKSVNIRPGYPTEIELGETVFDNLPKICGGLALEIVSGSGKGSTFGIASVYSKTGTTATHWAVLDREIKEGDVTPYGADTRQADGMFARGLGYHPEMSKWESKTAFEHERITTLSKIEGGIESLNDTASCFRLANSNGLFAVMVDKETTLTNDCLGVAPRVPLDVRTVGQVLTDDNYRLVTLSYGKSVVQSGDKIKVNSLQYVPANWDNKAMGTGRSCAVVWNPEYYNSTFSSSVWAQDGDALPRDTFTPALTATAKPYNGTAHVSAMQYGYYYRIDTPLVNGLYLGDEAIADVTPAIALDLGISTPSGTLPAAPFEFRVFVRAFVVDDNGVASEVAGDGALEDGDDISVPPCSFDTSTGTFVIQPGCETEDGPERINQLMDRLKTSLALGDKIKGRGPNAKYLYVQVCVRTIFATVDMYTVTAKVGARNPGLVYTMSVPKDNLYVKATRPGATINNPVALLRALCERFGVAYDAVSFAVAEAGLLASMGTLTDTPSVVIDSDDGLDDILAKICRCSNLSVYSDGSRLFARWWIADKIEGKTPALAYDNTSITKGGYGVSRDNGGYLSTNFKYNVSGLFGEKSTLSIDAGSVDSFPDETAWSACGDIMPDAPVLMYFKEADKASKNIEFTVTLSNKNLNACPWIPGYNFGITATDRASGAQTFGVYAVRSVAGWLTSGIKVLAECVSGELFMELQSMTHTFTARPWRTVRDWQFLVSGGLIDSSHYVNAYNLWEATKAARDALGRANAMDSRYTSLEIPVYSERASWLRSILFAVKHNTFARSIIRLEVPVTGITRSLPSLMLQYVRVSVGPYASTPTTGWVIGYSLAPASDTLNITIMTAASDEALVYDENGLTDQVTINEHGITSNALSELLGVK